MLYFLTHRRLYSTFSAEQAHRMERLLAEQGIPCKVKTFQSTVQSGALGQLAEYQIAYDLYVRTGDFARAETLLP